MNCAKKEKTKKDMRRKTLSVVLGIPTLSYIKAFVASRRIRAWCLFVFTVFSGLALGKLVSAIDLRESLALLNSYRLSIPTRLYDRNGELFAELYRHRQELVAFHQIPPHVIHAFLSVEDTNFHEHYGVDFSGILRALATNISAGKVVQGGSTLTQQLAKQIYLNVEGRRDRSYFQKIRELVLTLQIEEELSKEEILEAFFNVIYLGHGCKGLACAANLYFNKQVPELNLAEGALLARLPRAPLLYSPFKNPHKARRVHRYVLKRMAQNGYIETKQIDEIHLNFWKSYWPKIVLRPPSQSTWSSRLDMAPYFTEYVRQLLELVPEIGREGLYDKGLNIYTTLDRKHQEIAQKEMEAMRSKVSLTARPYALAKGVSGVDFELFHLLSTLRLLLPVPVPVVHELSQKEIFKKVIEEELLDGAQFLSYTTPASKEASALDFFRKQNLQSLVHLQVEQAFVSIQPQTGYITSMIGGSRFSPQNQFNRVLQARRQPGSSFKIFVYGAALERRLIGNMSLINDAPFLRAASDGTSWSPENYDPGFRGLVPARRALASSLNTCAVQLYFRLGPEPIMDIAGRLMKMAAPSLRFKAEPPLALGASEITPMELTTAMAIIGNGGRNIIPFAVRYVSDRGGNIIYNQEDNIRKILSIQVREKRIQIIEPGLSYILRGMLEYVSNSGTARYGLRSYDQGNFKGDFASKTGTTSNYSDAWITGFNPEYAATVWFGFDKSSITLGPGHSGGGIAAPVIGKFFHSLYKGTKQGAPTFSNKNNQLKKASLPEGVVSTSCDGIALASRRFQGEKEAMNTENIRHCNANRVYDERQLLMKELGITPEDLGEKGKRVNFR